MFVHFLHSQLRPNFIALLKYFQLKHAEVQEKKFTIFSYKLNIQL